MTERNRARDDAVWLNSRVLRRLLLALVGALSLATLSGCPEVARVEVTIKPASGAAGAADGALGDETATAPAGYGNLLGTVTFEGSPPDLRPLIAANDASVKDAAVCAAHAVPDESLVVNASNKGLANVVIFLDKRPATIKPELAEPPTEPVIFDQKGCRFLPHVLTVRIGQPLLILSGDSIPHNTQTNPRRNNTFNQTIPPNDRMGVPCLYTKPESLPIEATCSYHTWMKAYHFPIDHPYVAISDADGKFRIDGLPAGKHAFNVWHERGGLLERKVVITIEPDQDAQKDFSFGSTKFAAVAKPRPGVDFERLEQGGDILVSQTEGQR